MRIPLVPVDPDRDQARTWLEEELARPGYTTERSLVSRVLEWIGDRFDELLDWLDSLGQGVAGVPSWVLPVLLVVVAVVVLVLVRPRAEAV